MLNEGSLAATAWSDACFSLGLKTTNCWWSVISSAWERVQRGRRCGAERRPHGGDACGAPARAAGGEQVSQNPRMVGVGRDLCGSPSPTLLPKQGHLQQVVEDLVQAGLEYLQRRRLHSLPGQPGPGVCHPQREEVLPHVQTELPLLQFVPIAPCPVTRHH